jgi:hypothetical protein
VDTALPQHDAPAATLVVDALNRELRELTEKFPERKDSAVSGGLAERSRARSALKELVLSLHGLDDAIQAGQFEAAAAALGTYRAQLLPTVQAGGRHATGPCSIARFTTRTSPPCVSCTRRALTPASTATASQLPRGLRCHPRTDRACLSVSSYAR